MNTILSADNVRFDTETEILIVGAGACGLTAALAAREQGAEVVVLERDGSPAGSTSLSSGFVPAAPTRFQARQGLDDSAEIFAQDIQRKAHGLARRELVELAVNGSGPVVEWLSDAHGMEWLVLDSFLYPGHSRHRMHAVPEKTGAGLMARLLAAAADAEVTIATSAHATVLYVDSDIIRGVGLIRPDGREERISCRSLVLACNGFGGNPGLVARHIPEMNTALYFGHAGNHGDAVLWGEALDALSDHLTGYQGHGSVAVPHGILITWAVIMEGGIQVNANGVRFSDETLGYSEQAEKVLNQPNSVAWTIYDDRLHQFALGFEDYRVADEAGAVKVAGNAQELAAVTGLDPPALGQTMAHVASMARGATDDPHGRDFTRNPPLAAPFCAVKVTGALFHTQGGLVIDDHGRVLKNAGGPFPNLFAGGGAACGVSGPSVAGYLSGNGLLTALTFGRIAGTNAASR